MAKQEWPPVKKVAGNTADGKADPQNSRQDYYREIAAKEDEEKAKRVKAMSDRQHEADEAETTRTAAAATDLLSDAVIKGRRGIPKISEGTITEAEEPRKAEHTTGESRNLLRELVMRTVEMAGKVGGAAKEGFTKATDFLTSRTTELGNKLGGLLKQKTVEGAQAGKEKALKLAKYLNERIVTLGEQAPGLGKELGKNVLKTGEWYGKLPLKYKIGLSAALIGASVATGGAGTLVTILSAAKLGQRTLASAGVYAMVEGLMEKRYARQDMEAGRERRKWETWKKHGLAATATLAVFSGVPGYFLREGFTAVGGMHAVEWLGGALGIVPEHYTVPTTGGTASPPVEAAGRAPGAIASDVASAPTAEAAEETVAAVAAAPEVAEIASVTATPGQGYEYMMKQLVGKLPADFDKSSLPEGSDLRRLLDADPKSLGKVIHDLAIENKFYNPDGGTSVRIDLGSQMTVDADGDIFLGNTILADAGVPVTPPVPEFHIAPAEPAGNAAVPESLGENAPPPPHTGSYEQPVPTAQPEASAPQTEAPAPVHEAPTAHAEATDVPSTSSSETSSLVGEVGPHVFKNDFGTIVDPDVTHAYQGPNGVVFFGGDKSLDALAQDFAQQHRVPVSVDKSFSFLGIKFTRTLQFIPTDSGPPAMVPNSNSLLAVDPSTFTKRID